MLIGATTVFGELQDSLDRIWRAQSGKKQRPRGLVVAVRARVLSFGMILGIGFILMVSLVFSTGLAAIGKWWSPLFQGWHVVAYMVDLIFRVVLTTGMFALIYKIMPRVQTQWSEVWIGAAITALLFTIGKFLIGFYIGRSALTSGLGVAGSLLALLIWVYYSAQIFLIGAEFTWAYSNIYGSRKPPPEPTDRAMTTAEGQI